MSSLMHFGQENVSMRNICTECKRDRRFSARKRCFCVKKLCASIFFYGVSSQTIPDNFRMLNGRAWAVGITKHIANGSCLENFRICSKAPTRIFQARECTLRHCVYCSCRTAVPRHPSYLLNSSHKKIPSIRRDFSFPSRGFASSLTGPGLALGLIPFIPQGCLRPYLLWWEWC